MATPLQPILLPVGSAAEIRRPYLDRTNPIPTVNNPSYTVQERTLRLAHNFVEEARSDLERAVTEGSDIPPRIRTMHERPGHASPEYRTLAVPIPQGAEGSSPEVLSSSIASYARRRRPNCILLTLDVTGTGEDGSPQQLLIAEARDREGTRMYMLQPFTVEERRIRWQEPLNGGWQDPGEEEMILDAAFFG